MTPGEQALREAARLETARIYGKTCPEHRAEVPVAEPVEHVPATTKYRRLRAVS